MTYDGRGNTLTVTDPLGNTTVRTYDSRNNVLRRIDPHSVGDDPADFTTTFTYSDRGDLTSLTLPSGGTVFRDYDDFGNLTAIRDDQGNRIYAATYTPNGPPRHRDRSQRHNDVRIRFEWRLPNQ